MMQAGRGQAKSKVTHSKTSLTQKKNLTVIEEKRGAERAAARARRVERRLAVVADGVRVRPGLEEHAQGVPVPVEGGEVHGGHSPAADAVQAQPLGGHRDGVRVLRVAARLLAHADEFRQRLEGGGARGREGGKVLHV